TSAADACNARCYCDKTNIPVGGAEGCDPLILILYKSKDRSLVSLDSSYKGITLFRVRPVGAVA
ncbi:hypothetical protein, partial [Pseudomonas sp. HY13-MNA-CIBAN-0226]|uniref:hypothetical protein n=1 Tax=Pseudomonas sp. HY13-MNA-CIBAN-0226 TaxID=3140473 RepID=UPI00333347A3